MLGVAFGSSLAAGYVTPQGNITTWLNELAFVPVDYRLNAPVDEWSGDGGVGAGQLQQADRPRAQRDGGVVGQRRGDAKVAGGLDDPAHAHLLQHPHRGDVGRSREGHA